MNKKQYKTLGMFVDKNHKVNNIAMIQNEVFVLVKVKNHPPLEITINENGSYTYKRGNTLTAAKAPK